MFWEELIRFEQEFADGLREHSNSWFWVLSGPMTIFLFFPRPLSVLKWALGFD
jgi:hypothetical protein